MGDKITHIQQTSRKKVVRAVREAHKEHVDEGTTLDDFSKKIREKVSTVYTGFSKSRSRLIAKTETTVASNTGSRAAAKSLGIPELKKEWLSALDARTRDEDDSANHEIMNGVKVGLDEKFEVPSKDGTDLMDGPGDPTAPVDQVANCRCTQVYSQDGKSLNRMSAREKRRLWLKTVRKRGAHERAFAKDLSRVFEREADLVLEKIDGLTDQRLVEMEFLNALDQSREGMERALASNIRRVLTDFGQDILRLSE